MPQFREGDRVTIRAIVRFDQDGDKMLHVALDGGNTTMIAADKVTMAAAAWKVGDRLEWSNMGDNGGIVRAVAGTGLDMLLWVERPSGKMETVDAVICQRAEDVDPAELETPPTPVAIEAEWTVHDPALGAVPVFGPNWFVDVKGKDGVTREMVSPALVDWSNVVAYRDAEIPF